ncbi:MAG TPA: hypothetical protein VNN10_01110 [Dehalococcoidia bacterium]|nr:hypothetical protein [Dehalococcoidia bacterium]
MVLPASGGANLTLLLCATAGANGVIDTVPTATGALAVHANDEVCQGSPTDSDGFPNVFALTEAAVNGLDADGASDQILIVLQFTAPACTTQLYAFSATQDGSTIPGGEAVACSPVPTATPTSAAPTATPSGLTEAERNCGPPPGQATFEALGCTVVVTADPNVIHCHGRSTITASVRNRAGHVVPGFGFHFAVDNGLLTVVPNTASTEVATAILELFPTMPSATVIVSVGRTQPGTVEQEVLGHATVQNYCPSSSTTAGLIGLRASSPTVACGGRVFVAATVKDTLGNPVPDGTEITFLASQGSVKDEFVSTSGTPTPGGSSPSVKVPTRGGVANIIYTADGGAAGIVTITAASGAAFGSIDLSVCPSGTAGVGVRPPNTGARITPPSTGDAGLTD